MKNLKTFESFSKWLNQDLHMYRENCDRCKKPTGGTTTLSIFNEQVICMNCKDEERKDPEYKAADEAADEAYRLGIKNFKGAMPDYKPLKRN